MLERKEKKFLIIQNTNVVGKEKICYNQICELKNNVFWRDYMKKKTISILVAAGLIAVVLLFGLKNNGERFESGTESLSQEEDGETEISGISDIGKEETTEKEGGLLLDLGALSDKKKDEQDTDRAGGAANDAFVQDGNTENSGETGNTGGGGKKVNTTLGKDLTHKESVASNSGVEIPVLNKFNAAGLDPDCNTDDGTQDWFGYVGNENAAGYRNVTACAEAMEELVEAMDISGGFLPQQENISFSFTDMYAETGDLELRRDFDNGYYTIGINYDMSDSESFYPVEDGKDALTLLCSVVSSTPSELAEFLYQESFVFEAPVTSETTWITVGDCLVQWGGYDGNGEDVLLYRIKAK